MPNSFPHRALHPYFSLTFVLRLLTFLSNISRQTPEVTIQTYIRHLKEYNDMKDIAQQLIGLVAENRGVPVGSLYRNREFGVTEVD